jgi:hypothetical protein
MTKDFVVPLYTGTEPDILDDSDTQRESSVYKEFPNDMPIISPKRIQNQPYEQLELADGGSVERRGFVLGGDVKNTFYNLKKKLKRNPTVVEISKQISKNFNDLSYEEKKSIYDKVIYTGKKENLNFYKTSGQPIYQLYKQIGDVNFPVATKTGIKWPNKKIKDEYEQQIINRYKYAKSSADLEEQRKLGNLLTNKQLAKNFNINKRAVERLNEQIIKEYNLKKTQPIIGREEVQKTRDIKRKEAQLKFSDPGFEQKAKGTYKAHLGHMGDLYNRIVTSKNLGYTPAEINQAMTETLDPILKNISQAQDKLIKNKPQGWKQKLEEYNKKGINYSSLAEGYKSFDIIDPNTLEKYTYGVDYLKTIDPAALYEGKPIKEIASLTDKREINKIQKAFDDLTEVKKIARTEGLEQADISKIKNSELLTEENLKKLQDYTAFEQNKEAVMKAQSKIPASEKRRLVQMIGSIGCPTYAIGGRVNFSEGTDCYNKGLKALEEGNLTKPQLNVAGRAIAESGDEGILLKNLLSKAGTGIKFTGKGVGELISIGGGPAGVIAGTALETAFAAPYILEGDYKQALRQSIFGQIPSWLGVDVGSRDEDIVKLAKDAGVDQDSVRKFVDLKKNYIENEEYGQKLNMLDTMYKRDPKNFDYAEQIRRIENKIKPSADYLEKTVYSPKDLDKFQKDYLKAAKYFVDKNAARAPLPRSEEQIKSSTKDIFEESISAIRPEGDVQTILERENLLPQETQPQEELPDYYKVSAADGGRIGLSEGGGPKIGRRGFLGLIAGAAAAPDLIKALKGTGQAGKIASKIKLEKAEGMYPWFPDLIEKIKVQGKPFEEKEIIMEASYKHQAKGYGGLPQGVETVTRHVDGDTEFLLREYPDGRLAVDIHSPRNQEGSSTPVTLYYRPTMELKYYNGVKVEPAEFKVLEKEPRYFANGPDDVDIEMSEMRKVPGKDTIFGDVEAAERFATGKIQNRKIIPAKQARREQMEDAPTDFIEETSPYGPVYD